MREIPANMKKERKLRKHEDIQIHYTSGTEQVHHFQFSVTHLKVLIPLLQWDFFFTHGENINIFLDILSELVI